MGQKSVAVDTINSRSPLQASSARMKKHDCAEWKRELEGAEYFEVASAIALGLADVPFTAVA